MCEHLSVSASKSVLCMVVHEKPVCKYLLMHCDDLENYQFHYTVPS